MICKVRYTVLLARLKIGLDPVARRARVRLERNQEAYERQRVMLKAQLAVEREQKPLIDSGVIRTRGDTTVIRQDYLPIVPTVAGIEVEECDDTVLNTFKDFINEGWFGDTNTNRKNEAFGGFIDRDAVTFDDDDMVTVPGHDSDDTASSMA